MNTIKRAIMKVLAYIMDILGQDSMKLRLSIYRLDGAKIGKNVRAFSPIKSHEPYLLEIGDNVTISNHVAFLTHDNSVSKLGISMTDVVGKITIGDNCFIGYGVIINPGVSINANCIIGSGAVLTKSFSETGVIIAGNPARIIGSTGDFASKISEYAFNFRGVDRRKIIEENKSKLLIK